VTITQSDYEDYRTTVTDFDRQEKEDTCLLISLKNILDELATRYDDSELQFDLEDLEDICDYLPGWGCSAEFLPQQLNTELTRHNVEINTELDLETLSEIIESGNKSYPLVELDPSYFEQVNDYHVQSGMHGQKLPHIVIPFRINSNRVLFFDPYETFYEIDVTSADNTNEIAKNNFFELWSGRAEKRWTLWIERPEQRTLGESDA
jgi:hypothetical protein